LAQGSSLERVVFKKKWLLQKYYKKKNNQLAPVR
jgi:hypothetical protein